MLELNDIKKSFERGGRSFTVLDGASLSARAGEVTMLAGPSGIGKSTFFSIAAGLMRADSGSVSLDGRELTGLSFDELASVRRKEIGVLLQSGDLLNQFTAAENIELPTVLDGRHPDRSKTLEWLERFGIAQLAEQLPHCLSGGEKRRISLLRAFSMRPKAVIADEPASSLDHENALLALDYMRERAREDGIAVLMSSHDPSLFSLADRLCLLDGGRVKPL